MAEHYDLRGKTVLVTGGGRGVGRLLSIGAAMRGAHVVIWDVCQSSAERVRREVRTSGGSAESAAVDVADRTAVSAAAAAAPAVDVLINNAAVVSGKRLLEAGEEEIERTLQVNLHSLYWVTRAFLPGMVQRGHGAVVTVASTAGLVGVARQTDYSASKFAAFGFAESLRSELDKDRTGVASIVVCPSYVSTGMFHGVRPRFPLLLPQLRPENVAERILRCVEDGETQLVMPRLARAIPVARVMPVGMFDRTMNVFGVNTLMEGFRGHRSFQ